MEQIPACSVYVTERCVKVSGEVDLMSSASVIDAVQGATNAKLDVSGVTFMDSSDCTR